VKDKGRINIKKDKEERMCNIVIKGVDPVGDIKGRTNL